MITEDYVSFEIAKLLKGKGFDDSFVPVNCGFNTYDEITGTLIINNPRGTILAPTLQMAMKWLRVVHNIDISVTPDRKTGYSVLIFKDKRLPFDTLDSYSTYEEACEVAIKYCLENLI